MAEGTKDLRMAAVTMLTTAKEERQKLEAVVQRARSRQDDPTRKDVEEWIIISWELEIVLLDDKIKEIEKWLIENDFNY